MNTIKNLHQICRFTDYAGLDYDESCLWSELDESYEVAFDLSSGSGDPATLAIVTEFCEGLTGGII